MSSWRSDSKGGQKIEYQSDRKRIASFLGSKGSVDKTVVDDFETQFNKDYTYTLAMFEADQSKMAEYNTLKTKALADFQAIIAAQKVAYDKVSNIFWETNRIEVQFNDLKKNAESEEAEEAAAGRRSAYDTLKDAESKIKFECRTANQLKNEAQKAATDAKARVNIGEKIFATQDVPLAEIKKSVALTLSEAKAFLTKAEFAATDAVSAYKRAMAELEKTEKTLKDVQAYRAQEEMNRKAKAKKCRRVTAVIVTLVMICIIAIVGFALHSQGLNSLGLKYTMDEQLAGYIVSPGFEGITNGKTDLIIPDKFKGTPVVGIADETFKENSSLRTITIPDTVKQIGANAFSDCVNLQSVTIGNGVAVIKSNTFSNCGNLNDVILGAKITHIESGAFSDCSSLRSITFPKAIESVDESALDGCTNLSTIHFNGTKAEWLSVQRKKGWDKDINTNTIICSDGDAVMYAIEWVLNGGITASEMPFEYIHDIGVSEDNIPTTMYNSWPEYNYFLGWYEDADCTQPFTYDLADNPRNIILYAKWDLSVVYDSISQTPDTITGDRVIIDWSNESGDVGKALNIQNDVEKVLLVGSPNKLYTNTSITFSGFADNQEVLLSLSDFNYEGCSSSSDTGLHALTAVSSNNFVLNIDASGSSSIKTTGIGQDSVHLMNNTLNIFGDGKLTVYGGEGDFSCYGDQHGGSAINVGTLYLNGTTTVEVIGGKGDDARSSDGNGANGGVGIIANTITIENADASLIVAGGKGGNAYNRPSNDNDGDGSNGKDGYTGGQGGIGISTNKLTVISGSCSVTGGKGGRGGDGSEGNGNWFVKKQGGDGGTGGKGGCAIDSASIVLQSGSFSATGGNGGNGGSRGGMHEGNYGSNGSQGSGGYGGVGVSSNCNIETNSNSTHSVVDGTNGSSGTGTNQD